MSNHTHRVIEIVGVDATIRSGLARAAQAMCGLDWFEVQSIRGHLVDGAIAHFQVTMKVDDDMSGLSRREGEELKKRLSVFIRGSPTSGKLARSTRSLA
jgi:flavin-binding protein dodecin